MHRRIFAIALTMSLIFALFGCASTETVDGKPKGLEYQERRNASNLPATISEAVPLVHEAQISPASSNVSKEPGMAYVGRVFPVHDTEARLGFCSRVSIPRLHAVELENQRMRVWVRIANNGERDTVISVHCTQKDQDVQGAFHTFSRVKLPAKSFRDFSFVIQGNIYDKFYILVQC